MSETWLCITEIGTSWLPLFQCEVTSQKSDFWPNVSQTLIGSFLGFIFGLGAFVIQQWRQSKADDDVARQLSLDALNRLNFTAGVNIEALVMARLQFAVSAKPEIEAMQTASLAVHEADHGLRETKLTELNNLSGTMHQFYQSLPSTSAMEPPSVTEYSSHNKDMPALPLFVHRAMGMTQQLNELITSRNALLAEHARESGGGSLTGNRLLFYSSMLSDQGDGICVHIDDAIFCWKLAAEQVKAYFLHKAKGAHFVEYQFAPEAANAITEVVEIDPFPLMRQQLRTFEDSNS